MKNRRKCVFSFSSNFLLLTIFIHAILLAISNTRSALLSNDGGDYFSSTWDGFVSNKHGCPLQSPNVKRSSKTPNYYEIDNQSSSLTVSQKPLLQPRAYPIRKEPFPCLPEHDTAIRWMRDNTPTDTGFLFLKTHKTASSTAAGVHLRIAHHVARNRLIASHEKKQDEHINNTYSTDIICKVRFNHARARVRLPLKPETLPKDRFLWTIVRDPTDRLVSFFFHFIVAWDKKEPTTYNFQNSVLHSQSDVRVPHYYAFFLSLEPFARFAQNEARYLQNILDSYDFIGVTERLDESLVALSFLLDLPLAHFLYLSAKGKGGFDAGGNNATCYYIPPSFVSPGMRTFMATPTFQQHVQWDHLFHQAAHASLDRTIRETIGSAVFAERLRQFRYAQRVAQETCRARTVFPCSAENEGKPRPPNETDCLWKDSGCGHHCLDEVATRLGLWGGASQRV